MKSLVEPVKYIDIDGQELKIRIDNNGTKYYFNSKNELHRLGGPALEYFSGHLYWFKNHKSHRIGGPATILTYADYYIVNGNQVSIYYIYG